MRKLVPLTVAVMIVAVLLPASVGAKTRRVGTLLSADVFGVIDRHGSVSYAYGGEVGTGSLILRCEEGRRVRLFKVEANGTPVLVSSTRSDFLGTFSGAIERPLDQIAGYYYAEVAPKKFKAKNGKFKCLPARSETFLVEVPAGLTS